MRLIYGLFILIFLCSAGPAPAEDVYQTPEAFIAESFSGQPAPEPLTLEPDEVLSLKISKIMGSHYRPGPFSYWARDGRTAWILEDIGKFEPITAGFLVGPDGRLERVKVLIYRESHGWEVRHDFFTRQFEGAGLKRERKLDQPIDGISGATLSVGALKRMSALTLLLHSAVAQGGSTP
jgi:hypothetical protein